MSKPQYYVIRLLESNQYDIERTPSHVLPLRCDIRLCLLVMEPNDTIPLERQPLPSGDLLEYFIGADG